jgi:hypothetical protein
MSVSMSFVAGKEAGQIFGVRAHGGTRQMAICPNDLIKIAATIEEGNAGIRARCCFDEDAVRGYGSRGRVPNWEEQGYPDK